MEVAKRVEGQVGTTQGEVGRMDIGMPRNRQGGRSRSWEVVVEEVRNTHSDLANIHERHGEVVARIVQAAWPNTGVGVGTDHIHPSRSPAHILVRILR